MSTYKPRSGTFRKLKYPIKIYKTEELPPEDTKDVLDMIKKIKAEETLECIQYQDDHDETEECKGRLLDLQKKKSLQLDDMKLLCSSSDSKTTGKLQKIELPHVQVSLVQDNHYKRFFADDDALPPFPVTTFSGFGGSSGSEESEQESDYDLDTDDEQWLEAHQELNITPNRLEYIFTKLNKRNTHVPKNAIGALTPSFHRDFTHLFPYWKEKRLQNKNLSTFKPNYQQIDARKKETKSSGYIANNPYVTFACKVRKPLPQQHQPPSTLLEKIEKRDEFKRNLKRVLETRDKLACFRVRVWETLQNSLNDRAEIVTKINNLTQNPSIATTINENSEPKLKTEQGSRLRKHKETSFVKPTPIPTRVSARLSSMSKNTLRQKRPVSTMKLVAPSPSRILGPRKLRGKENENKPTKRGKLQKPSFESVRTGTSKNKSAERIAIAGNTRRRAVF